MFSDYVNNIFLLDGLWSGYKAFTTGKLATSVNDSDGLHVIAGTSLSPFKVSILSSTQEADSHFLFTLVSISSLIQSLLI